MRNEELNAEQERRNRKIKKKGKLHIRLPGQSSPHTHTQNLHTTTVPPSWPPCIRCCKARRSPQEAVYITSQRYGSSLERCCPATEQRIAESLLDIWTYLATTVFWSSRVACVLRKREFTFSRGTATPIYVWFVALRCAARNFHRPCCSHAIPKSYQLR